MSGPLEEIKRLYYGTTRATILRDFDRAIDLLKTMASEEDRERATAYMHGLTEMRNEWYKKSAAFGVRSAGRKFGVQREERKFAVRRAGSRGKPRTKPR